jgi:CheY-like chemotaxis protein
MWFYLPNSCGSPYSPYPLKRLHSHRDEVATAYRLLIVEDNASVRRLIKRVVADLATAIYECADGAEALAEYTCHRPDFVLMDIRMSRMDGITATRQIKAVDAAARIIIVTEYDQAELREASKQAGAIAYVLKDNLLDLVSILKV